MEQQKSELTIIADGQAPPAAYTTPPRRARWYDTFSYIANPERLIYLFDWQLTSEASFVQFPLKKIKNNYQINLQKR